MTDPKPSESQGFVYFVQGVQGGPVKVGWAKDPTLRLRELQVGNPEELVVIDTHPGPPAEERRLHGALRTWKARGEWFHATPELREAARSAIERPLALAKLKTRKLPAARRYCAACAYREIAFQAVQHHPYALALNEHLQRVAPEFAKKLGITAEPREEARLEPGEKVSLFDRAPGYMVAGVVMSEPRGQWVTVRVAQLGEFNEWEAYPAYVRITDLRERSEYSPLVDEALPLCRNWDQRAFR